MAEMRVVGFLCVVVAAAGQQARLASAADCRLCPEGCQTVPRADGSCPVCICDGVALTDCGPAPSECSEGCQMERGIEGCLECSCRRRDATLCPSVGACPEECQQLVGGSSCPECVCDVPEPFCPHIECPEDCKLVEQEGGCPSCRCDPPAICPAIPECLRGCIDRDQEGECFLCNCTTPTSHSPEGKPTPPGAIVPSPQNQRPSTSDTIEDDLSSERNPSFGGPILPVESGRPTFDRGSPVPQCPNQRSTCPPGCRIGITSQGCRECYCGANAVMCPGVDRCSSRCQYMDPEDGCCSCKCPQRPAVSRPFIPWKRFKPSPLPPPVYYGPPRPW